MAATPQAAAAPLRFSAEINGLRGLSVLLVVWFHAGLAPFSGGFIGVDVFFVISGFLITTILAGETASNAFSLTGFVERRCRRLAPAMLASLALTVLAMAALLTPPAAAAFSESLLAAIAFFPNFHFAADAGYFTAEAESKPLLHFWSLGVEVQFYLCYGAFFIAAQTKIGHRGRLIAHALLAALSFALAEGLVRHDPELAFYAPFTRFWEFLVGSLVALWLRGGGGARISGAAAGAAAALGGAAILASGVLYDGAQHFPGLAAAPAVIGAAAILVAAQRGAPGMLWLRLRPLAFLGTISYPLYLVHWPALVAVHIISLGEPDLTAKAGAVAASVLLAALIWRGIEDPIRTRRILKSRRRFALGLGVGLGALMGAGLLGIATEGGAWRAAPKTAEILSAASDRPSAKGCERRIAPSGGSFRACPLGTAAGPAAFVILGDSHAAALRAAGEVAADRLGVSGLLVAQDGCPPLPGVAQARRGFDQCDAALGAFLEWLKGEEEIAMVLIAARWSLYATGQRFGQEPGAPVLLRDETVAAPNPAQNIAVLERGMARMTATLEAWGAASGGVYAVLAQPPEHRRDVAAHLAQAAWLGQMREHRTPRAAHDARQAPAMAALTAALAGGRRGRLIDWTDRFCDADGCATAIDGVPIYSDSNHLTQRFAATLGPRLAAAIAEDADRDADTGATE